MNEYNQSLYSIRQDLIQQQKYYRYLSPEYLEIEEEIEGITKAMYEEGRVRASKSHLAELVELTKLN